MRNDRFEVRDAPWVGNPDYDNEPEESYEDSICYDIEEDFAVEEMFCKEN